MPAKTLIVLAGVGWRRRKQKLRDAGPGGGRYRFEVRVYPGIHPLLTAAPDWRLCHSVKDTPAMTSIVSAGVNRRRRKRKRRGCWARRRWYRFGLRVYPEVHPPPAAAHRPDWCLCHSVEGVPTKTWIVVAGVGWRRRKQKQWDAGHGSGRYRFGSRVHMGVHPLPNSTLHHDQGLYHSVKGVLPKTLIVLAGVGWRQRKQKRRDAGHSGRRYQFGSRVYLGQAEAVGCRARWRASAVSIAGAIPGY